MHSTSVAKSYFLSIDITTYGREYFMLNLAWMYNYDS